MVFALVYGSGRVHGSFHCGSISMQAEVWGGEWWLNTEAAGPGTAFNLPLPI